MQKSGTDMVGEIFLPTSGWNTTPENDRERQINNA